MIAPEEYLSNVLRKYSQQKQLNLNEFTTARDKTLLLLKKTETDFWLTHFNELFSYLIDWFQTAQGQIKIEILDLLERVVGAQGSRLIKINMPV